jgi:hypothetical protein
MTPGHLLHFFLFRLLPILLFGLLGSRAMAQTDPPGRVARLNHAEGPVVFSPAGDNEWTDAEFNRPLTRGDRLWTDRKSRAEIQVGSSAVRMDGQTYLEIVALDDQSAQLSVTQGTVYVRVRALPEGENFEIDTPNLAYRAAYPGDYRIDVDAARATTRVTVQSGTGAVYGESGQALPLGGGQQITFRARSLAQVNAQESPPQDAFDRWAAERNRHEDQSIAARYVPREVVGYQQLDAHGQWSQDPTHGAVWYPQGTAANWAPYRDGHWEWISPWGWTWVDEAPWGFAPFHYGRWAMIGSRWAWVPGRIGLRPVYAPALVAFIGGSSGGVNWSISIGSGRPGVAWFPLAPGEAWQPGYRASPVYISNVNRNIPVQANPAYAHQRRPEALTAISAEDFHRGRPVRGGWLRVAANTLTNAQIVPPPPMPERSGVLAQRRAATPVRLAPPDGAEIRQVIAKPVQASPQEPGQSAERERETKRRETAQQQAQAQVQQQADAQRARQSAEQQLAQRDLTRRAEQARRNEQAGREQQAKVNLPPKRAQPAKLAHQTATAAASAAAEPTRSADQGLGKEQARRNQAAVRAEHAKRGQLARRAEPAKREQTARRAEQTRRGQPAMHAQAQREQPARRAEQSRREEQTHRAELARRKALARRDEQLRREAHTQRVEQARRAAERDAQALREQRAQREEQARRESQEREQAQREVLQRQQQALSEQSRRDHQLEQQRERMRQRPDLRDDRRPPAPEVWQRGIPILNPGRTS